VTSAGVVTRPEPDGTDHAVTLTATITKPRTGATATKVFELTIVKMTDQDAVSEAARQMSAEDTFDFENSSDIWESVTGEFLILTNGLYDTDITWTSGNPDVIAIGGVDSATGKYVRHRYKTHRLGRERDSDGRLHQRHGHYDQDLPAGGQGRGFTREITRSSASGTTFDLASADGRSRSRYTGRWMSAGPPPFISTP
jgi:hypothetical protein